jgi:beta-glucanase (GH16 family)
LVLDDNFETINLATWSHEVGIGGFGYGSFDWTTDDPANSYTTNNGLHIIPTLTVDTTSITANQILNGYTLNLTTDGTCTSPALIQCARYSNITNGTVINPVRSARLTTAGKVSIKYGRVEVVAKMPVGDWLWPSIWMYPENETYGAWPRSGEIDIGLVRGNSAEDYDGGRDTVTSALHWGPSANLDQSARTTGKLELRREDLASGFHTYGVEWSETHFFTWIDDRVWEVTHTGFGASYGGNMYERGGFPNMWIAGQL